MAEEGTAARATPKVSVSFNLQAAKDQGTIFFDSYRAALVSYFRECVMATLKTAKAFAPKGDHDYVIGHGTEIRKVAGGTLRRALTAVVQTSQLELTGVIGVPADSPAAKYARMRELGGTIRAVHGPYLVFSPDGQSIVRTPVVHQDPHPYAQPALVWGFTQLTQVPSQAWEVGKRFSAGVAATALAKDAGTTAVSNLEGHF